ncbi:RluA family pseudouridine synthase [Kordia zhangzhouensis]|uniref:RluA family pseudouridine synthase n=1 Tax=Kordia zhangzhouensis TaxID=1620405 RepID=UPI0006293756|nr:RluA family pseudouridine synthase [Kordia zhangzhouensis]
MKLLESHIVHQIDSPVRIQEYPVGHFKTIMTKSALKKMIKKKVVYINGTIATTATFVSTQDLIEVYEQDYIPKKVFKLEIPILFEDDFIAIINKPAGFPTSGNYFKTIENALPHNLKTSNAIDALPFPKPVHRLDNPTSGILIIAKTKTAQLNLHQQFERQKISKTYQAIVLGKTPEKGQITSIVAEKDALTYYETLQTVPSLQNQFLSHVKLLPKTGRTHQLRVHLASISHPIVGDQLYGKASENYKKGLFLCATSIACVHPITNKNCCFSIEPPNKYYSLLNREIKRFSKFNLT